MPAKQKFKKYPLGYFHIDMAEVHTEEGRQYLFVAIDRASKFAFAELHEKASRLMHTSSNAGRKSRNAFPSIRTITPWD